MNSIGVKGGRTVLRHALYMAVLSAIRYNSVIAPYYQKLLLRGKPKKVAQTACARKLLVILNAMFVTIRYGAHIVRK